MVKGLFRAFLLSVVRISQFLVFYLLTESFNAGTMFLFACLIFLERFIQDVEIV